MRTQQLLALSGLMLMSNVVAGAELERDDVPNRCWHVCGPVVGIARTCDNVHHDNDRAEMNCICDWNKVNNLVPICEACIAQYRSDRKNRDTNRKDHDDDDDDDDDDWDTDDEYDNDHDDKNPHDNDAYDILTSCNLKTTTYNSAAATKAADSASSSGTAADSTATPTGSAADSKTDDASAQNARTTENAAPGTVAPKAAAAAAVAGLGFLAYL